MANLGPMLEIDPLLAAWRAYQKCAVSESQLDLLYSRIMEAADTLQAIGESGMLIGALHQQANSIYAMKIERERRRRT